MRTSFIVHYSILPSSMDSGLRDWAQGQKFIPWVTVVAQVPVSRFPSKFRDLTIDYYTNTGP